MRKLSLPVLAGLALLAGMLSPSLSPAAGQAGSPAVSPALQRLLLATLERNPRLQAARAAVEAAEARLRAAARPLYNPELEIDAEQAETRSATLGFRQSIDWSDKRARRVRGAESALQAARADYARLRNTLASELLAALGRYHTARALDALAEQRQELMRRFLDLARKRHAAGDLSQVELDLAQLAHTEVQLERSQTASELAEAEQALVALTGAMRSDWPMPGTRLAAPVLDDISRILDALPRIQAMRARTEAARAEVALRRGERRPDPTLGLRAGQEKAFRDGADDTFGVIGLSLELPLFVRNDFRAEVDAAAADLAQAQADLEQLRRKVRAELLSAAQRYRLERQAWQAWEAAGETSLERQLALLERFWRVGELSSADYLVQLDQTLDTRAAALRLRGRLWSAWAEWLRASGQIASLFADLSEPPVSRRTP